MKCQAETFADVMREDIFDAVAQGKMDTTGISVKDGYMIIKFKDGSKIDIPDPEVKPGTKLSPPPIPKR